MLPQGLSPCGDNSGMSLSPTEIIVHQASHSLEIHFDSGESFDIPFELMRVYSPSAEVQGHGLGQEVLQTGKRHVQMESIEPVGHYGIKPVFSDGHDSGIFTWIYLHHLGKEQESLWAQYERRLKDAGKLRDEPMHSAAHSGCHHH
jgi:DUF971 family protein